MDKGFYISKIIVSNRKEKASEISFTEGCNIIYGPSNTGKSLIVNCINYALGSKDFKSADNSDILDISYVTIELTTNEGKVYSISRKVFDNNKTVHIKCLSELNSVSKKMSTTKLTTFLLSLLGFENRQYKIINSKDYRTCNLSFRTLIGTSIIDEEKIIAKDSIFHQKAFDAITATLSAIYVYITGKEQPEINQKDIKLQKAKKEAVEAYIQSMINKIDNGDFHQENADCLDSLIAETENRISKQESILHEFNDELVSLQTTINSLLIEKQNIEYRLNRYEELKQDYAVDIQRAEFIIDGEKSVPEASQISICPICSSEIKPHMYRKLTNYAKVEKDSILHRLKDLEQVISQIEIELREKTEQIDSFESRLISVNKKYTEESSALSTLVSQMRQLTEKKAIYDSLSQIRLNLQSGLSEEYIDLPKEYKIKEVLSDIFFSKYENYLERVLSQCNYTNYKSVNLDTGKIDISPNGESKQAQGKGYRAFLNSVVALSFMIFMKENACYYNPFLILDSPLMSLKEVEENSSDSMKSGLLNYILNNQNAGQVIIIENELPKIDYSNANLIEFTGKNDTGRYGFILNNYFLDIENNGK